MQNNVGRLANRYKDAGYQTFARSGDIYFLFYERAIDLLKGGGYLCFISSNQWMRVKGGKILRQFIEGQNPLLLVNLGAGVFDSVTVNTCVIVMNRNPNQDRLKAADMRQATQQFPPEEWFHISPTNGATWIVLPLLEQRVKAKIDAIGTPLKEWDLNIRYGVKTGYDKAFLIDNATKDALVTKDCKSAEILKPVLQGRNVDRFQAHWAGRWLVNIPWHFPLHLGPTVKGSSSRAENLFKKQYPAIYQHLFSHKAGLSARNKAETGIRYEWFALQRWGANYHEDFAKEKIVWGNLNNQARFAYAPEGMFICAPTTMLTPYSPYLLALLNSTLLDWYFRLIGVERDAGYYEYKPMFIERLPIPKISTAKQRPFVRLVDQILEAKDANPDEDTSDLEREIDRMVYELYGLTEEEITVIERSLGLIHATDEEKDAALLKIIEDSQNEERLNREVVIRVLREE